MDTADGDDMYMQLLALLLRMEADDKSSASDSLLLPVPALLRKAFVGTGKNTFLGAGSAPVAICRY